VEIPWEMLPASTLQGLVEEFVLREGTEYGATEHHLHAKVAQVLDQIRRGEVRITFDRHTGTTSLSPRTNSM
jgi:uncharacterized protein